MLVIFDNQYSNQSSGDIQVPFENTAIHKFWLNEYQLSTFNKF